MAPRKIKFACSLCLALCLLQAALVSAAAQGKQRENRSIKKKALPAYRRDIRSSFWIENTLNRSSIHSCGRQLASVAPSGGGCGTSVSSHCCCQTLLFSPPHCCCLLLLSNPNIYIMQVQQSGSQRSGHARQQTPRTFTVQNTCRATADARASSAQRLQAVPQRTATPFRATSRQTR